MPANLTRIQDFLRRPGIEGPQRLQGYIPSHILDGNKAGRNLNCTGHDAYGTHDPIGVSGVTIATGVDLGQTDAATLRKIGVDAAVISLFSPFLGKKDKDAVKVFHRVGGLAISQAEADMLDDCIHRHHCQLISARYDRDAGAGAFASLPWQAQAAIFSVLYQRGTGYASKMPKTWGHLVRRDWQAAAEELCTGFTQYSERRALEGKLLKEMA